jgi:hypothetical protein
MGNRQLIELGHAISDRIYTNSDQFDRFRYISAVVNDGTFGLTPPQKSVADLPKK